MSEEPRTCRTCGAPLVRRRKESRQRFDARRVCGPACDGRRNGAAAAIAYREALPTVLAPWPAWARFDDIGAAEAARIAAPFATPRALPAIPALTAPTPERNALMRVLDAIYYASQPPESAYG